MKILRIITRLNVGGPAIHVADLSGELTKLGHKTTVVTGITPNFEGTMEHYLYGKDTGSDIIVIPSLVREMSPKKDWYAFRNLIRIIKRENPDIIHTHMAKAGLLTRLAALWVRVRYKKKFKLIHTFHGHVFHSYFGRWKSKMFILLERLMARWTDAIVAISESQKEELVEYGIALASRIKVIPLGFNLEPFLKLKPFKFDDNCLKVGIIGRLTPIKDHKLFFDFICELRKHIPIFATVIGDGELKNELVDMCYKKGLSYILPFRSWVKYEDMPIVYKDLDVVVCSSLNEGVSVVGIETMASGRLFVSTKVGGMESLVGESMERGIYLHPGNIEKSAEDLLTCLRVRLYWGITHRARLYVQEEHSLGRLVGDIENLYQEICHEN